MNKENGQNIVNVNLKSLSFKLAAAKLMQVKADLIVVGPHLLIDPSGDETAQLMQSGSMATEDVVNTISTIHDILCDLLCKLGCDMDDEGGEDEDEIEAKIKEVKANFECISRKISTKERKDAKDSDFVIPENRSFPILKPEDVPAAVHSFGRSKSGVSFEKFKARLIRIAKRKGFESFLPKEWKDEKKD